MVDELKYSMERLNKAFLKLKDGSAMAVKDIEKDGVIKRFEFTFELLWKTLKLFLKEKGADERLPKDILKAAFRHGWIEEEETFLKMLEDRNVSAHEYAQEKVEEIFRRIKEQYVPVIAIAIKEFDTILKEITD